MCFIVLEVVGFMVMFKGNGNLCRMFRFRLFLFLLISMIDKIGCVFMCLNLVVNCIRGLVLLSLDVFVVISEDLIVGNRVEVS